MVLAIYIARHGDEDFHEPRTDILAAQQFTIGRGHDCSIALDDNTRRVSRRHVAIERRGDAYLLNVVSQINPVVVNGEVVAPGAQQPLQAGDRLIIGEYEFGFVTVDESEHAERPEPLSILPAHPVRRGDSPVDLDVLFGASATPAPGPAPKAPPSDLQDLFASRQAQAADPLLDVLGRSGTAPRRGEPADPLAHILGQGTGSAAASTGSPDEFVHGGGGESPIDALLKGSGMPAADPLGLSRDLPGGQGQYGGGVGGSVELDHVHDVHLPFPVAPAPPPAAPPVFARRTAPAPAPQPAPAAEPLSPLPGPLGFEPQAGQPAPAANVGPDPLAAILGEAASRPPADDPLGLFGATTEPSILHGAVPPSAPAVRGAPTVRSPYLSAGQLRESATPPLAPAPSMPPPAVASAAGASAGTALAAFLRGAGMPAVDVTQADADALLAECGATVRAAVEGLMGMLLARAKMKEELRAVDRTMVAAKENNALKLAESVDEALQFVFDASARSDAFLPPPKAIADACNDLQTHELALVAGMRAALIGAIKRFDPAGIEKRLEKEGGGKSLLANRKAQLWDCFVAYYQQTQTEADDNFDRVFGAAFLRAYQEQIRQLSR